MTSSDPAASTAETASSSARLSDDLGWALRAVSSAFRAEGRAVVAAVPGGHRGYLVLLAVSDAAASSQLELAQRLSIDKTQMTAVIDALAESGLIDRTPDPADRRARLVTITSAGAAVLATARRDLAAVERRLFAPLETSEQDAVRSALSRMASVALAPAAPDRLA